MKSPKLPCVAAVLMLLLSMGLTATAQQNAPWNNKLCKGYIGACGIVVTFNPPLGDVLSVPNEVTVDVPLELGKVSKVVVSSYPLGTQVADIPSGGFAVMYRSRIVGKYARFIGKIKQCTNQGSLSVDVLFKGFEHYPMSAGVGGAIECEQSCTTDKECPTGQRCGFPVGCGNTGTCVVPSSATFCNPHDHCGCDGHPVTVFCVGGDAGGEYTSAPATVAPCP